MTILEQGAISDSSVAALSVARDAVFWDRDLTGFGVSVIIQKRG